MGNTIIELVFEDNNVLKNKEILINFTLTSYNIMNIENGIGGLRNLLLKRPLYNLLLDCEKFEQLSDIDFNNIIKDKSNLTCSITYEELNNSEILICKKCNSCFKKDNLLKWLKDNKKCPYCTNVIIKPFIYRLSYNIEKGID